MPSPVGHSLSGILAYLIFVSKRRSSAWLLVGFAVWTILPDFDFIPGWLIGQPNLFHRGASHSLFFAAILGITVGLAARTTGRGKFLPVMAVGFTLYALHIVLDLFSVDYGIPGGFQVLWPIDNGYYIAPSVVFMNITRSAAMEEFIPSLFNVHNLQAVIRECVIFFPLILLVWSLKGRFWRDNRPYNRRTGSTRVDIQETGDPIC